jgi:hypothetical protein
VSSGERARILWRAVRFGPLRRKSLACKFAPSIRSIVDCGTLAGVTIIEALRIAGLLPVCGVYILMRSGLSHLKLGLGELGYDDFFS